MRKTPPYAPGRVLEMLVSPVSVKENSLNPVPGRKTPFSGRLSGVAFAALAAAVASNASVVPVWIVTHAVAKDEPYVCSAPMNGSDGLDWSCDVVAGVPSARLICNAWRVPPRVRSLLSFG